MHSESPPAGRSSDLPAVCILAGGLGTRLGKRSAQVPKPLIEVAGRPFLAHQLDLLSSKGITRAVLCVGYLGELIEQTMGTTHAGIELTYSYDEPGLDGTLGAIRRAAPLLGERFLVLYGDTYLRIDYRDVVLDWAKSGDPALMTVLHNKGEWDTSNAIFSGGKIVAYDKFLLDPEMEWIDYGLGGLTPPVLDLVPPEERDLAALQSVLAQRGMLHGYEATERFFEIGTAEALEETDRYLTALEAR